MSNAYKIFIGEQRGKRSLVKPMHRWRKNIKMGLK
jgi:hypothetical protein